MDSFQGALPQAVAIQKIKIAGASQLTFPFSRHGVLEDIDWLSVGRIPRGVAALNIEQTREKQENNCCDLWGGKGVFDNSPLDASFDHVHHPLPQACIQRLVHSNLDRLGDFHFPLLGIRLFLQQRLDVRWIPSRHLVDFSSLDSLLLPARG